MNTKRSARCGDGQTRSHICPVRLSDEELSDLDMAARSMSVDRSTLIRLAIHAAAEAADDAAYFAKIGAAPVLTLDALASAIARSMEAPTHNATNQDQHA